MRNNPVIRAEEQLVIIVSSKLTFTGMFNGLPTPRVWNATLEVERKQYDTIEDIIHLADGKPEEIRKVLRVCMSTGVIEDITHDVLEYVHPFLEAAE